jgi:hypothetical protein
MTILLGYRGAGFSFLAADTRRRDHVTGAVRRVSKVHKLSNSLLVGQGGAGTGAADEVVKAIKAQPAEKVSEIEGCVAAVHDCAPAIMRVALTAWSSRGRLMPPTCLVIAYVDQCGFGRHTLIDLVSGHQTDLADERLYVAGTNTRHFLALAETRWEEFSSANGCPQVPLDVFASKVIDDAARADPNNVGMPCDVGIVRVNGSVSEVFMEERADCDAPASSDYCVQARN